MAVLPVLYALRDIEEKIEIDEPVRIRKPRAFLIVPDRTVTLAHVPAAFENRIAPNVEEFRMGDTREDHATIRVRFTAHDANYDKACEIAVAMFDETWAVFDAQREVGTRLNETVSYVVLRGTEGEIPSDFNGRPGWEIFLDCTLFSESRI